MSLGKVEPLCLYEKLDEDHIKCKICNLQFNDVMALRDHIRSHEASRINNGNDAGSCEFCEKLFQSKKELILHLSRVHGADNIIECCCVMCGDFFVTSKGLSLHVSDCHRPKNPPYRCDFCPLGFNYESNLKVHVFYAHQRK